jgi:peptidoglycan/LPS O-acetylase OafA/YrhL
MKSLRHDSLDAMRGFAAMVVVLSHCFRSYENTSEGFLWWLEKTPLRLLVSGRPAVILFFVLSGFVLAVSLEAGIRYRDFIIRRFCRIYLPFAASIVLAAALYSAIPEGGVPGFSAWFHRAAPVTWTELAGHFLMVGDFQGSYLNRVIWSLAYELRISLVFPLIMWVTYRYPTWRVLAASTGLALLAYAALRSMGYGPRDLHFSSSFASGLLMTVHFSLYFVMGAALAKHRQRLIGMAASYTPLVRFGILVVSGVVLLGANMFITDITLGIFSAVLIVLVLAGGGLTNGIFLSRPALFLGRVSYSLYLVHMPIFFVLAHTMFNGGLPRDLVWIVWPAAALAAAAIAYHLVEHPSHRLGRWIVAWLERPVHRPATSLG